MKIYIKDREIKLIPRDVKIAKKIILGFMNSVKTKSQKLNAPTFYYTFLLMMHLMSQDQINALTPDTMQLLLNGAYRSYENAQKKKNESA